MRSQAQRFLTTIAAAGILTLLLKAPTAAQQIIPFDGLDWTQDQGNIAPFYFGPFSGVPATNKRANSGPLRPGFNEFYNPNFNDALNNKFTLDPGPGTPRWIWPFTRDIYIANGIPIDTTTGLPSTSYVVPASGSIVDNRNGLSGKPVPPAANQQIFQFTPAGSTSAYVGQSFQNNPVNDPTRGAENGLWTTRNVAFGSATDYRAAGGGFSFELDPTIGYSRDYFYTTSQLTANDYQITAKDSKSKLDNLPNVSADLYNEIHQATLRYVAARRAVYTYTSGLLQPGRYAIDIYSPGDGTRVYNAGGTLTATRRAETRVLVRVSWRRTVNGANNAINFGTGVANAGGTQDPVTSRLFLVNMSQNGWIRLVTPGLGPASFPHRLVLRYPVAADPDQRREYVDTTADQRDQLAVTVYALAPKVSWEQSDPVLSKTAPVVMADAVRFVPVQLYNDTTNLNSNLPGDGLVLRDGTGVPRRDVNGDLIRIPAAGRVLASAAGTAKLYTGRVDEHKNDLLQPVTYIAREEGKPERLLTSPELRSRLNPSLVKSANNPDIADPTAMATMPVFYCLDNRNGNIQVDATEDPGKTVFPTGSRLIYSSEKVIWRYEGVADGNNLMLKPTTVGGSIKVSPLLANVRCRDGVVRQIIYFCTSSVNGQVGHVYALRAEGDAPTVVSDPKPQTTTAYWTYPSYRPKRGTEIGTALANLPPQVYDYNFTRPGIVGVPLGYPSYPTIQWGPDFNLVPYVDGDIIRTVDANNIATYTVKSDTRVPFSGVTGAPLLIEDPNLKLDPALGANLPQVLLVPNSNGRIFAFDAGGRGDFGPVSITRRDGNNNVIGTSDQRAAGTTQRIWTWPRPAGDYYHAGLSLRPSPNPLTPPDFVNNGFTIANPYAGEASKVGFTAGLAYDPYEGEQTDIIAQPGYNRGANVIAGAADGHIYAFNPVQDSLGTPSFVNGVPNFVNKQNWQFPAANQTMNGTPSTPTIARVHDSSNNLFTYLYFTLKGRTVALSAANTLGATESRLKWVYPYTPNAIGTGTDIFAPNPSDTTTSELGAYFTGPPVVMAGKPTYRNPDGTIGTATIKNPNNNLALPQDTCYALQNDGTLLALDAFGNASRQTTLLAYNQTLEGNYTASTITGAVITSQPAYDEDAAGSGTIGITQKPVMVVSDSSGVMNAFGLVPIDDGAGGKILPLLWRQEDYAVAGRSAATILTGGDDVSKFNNDPTIAAGRKQGILVTGDEGGQVYAYGFGLGSDGTGTTVGYSPIPPQTRNLELAIDMRSLDFYDRAVYNQMARNVYGGFTPGKTETAANFANTREAAVGNLDPGVPNAAPAKFAVDWGDNFFVVAWGVYHALSTWVPPAASAFGRNAPTVSATFTVTQQGQTSKPYGPFIAAVPPHNLPPLTTSTGVPRNEVFNNWPDDSGIAENDATREQLHIFGIEPSAGDTSIRKLTGRGERVYPWVVKFTLPIKPSADAPYTPTQTNYRITGVATVTQQIQQANTNTTESVSQRSNVLNIGNRDWKGRSESSFGRSPNRRRRAGDATFVNNPIQVYITNPIAITTRGGASQGPGSYFSNQPNIIGWGSGINDILSRTKEVQELISNGTSRLEWRNNAISNDLIYAPVGLVQDGGSGIYSALNGTQADNGLYVMDRSNLMKMTGRPVSISAIPQAGTWQGGASSVMNALPWETVPDSHNVPTADYPAIPASAFQMFGLDANGQASGDLVNSSVSLTPPSYATTDPLDPTRTTFPTPIRLQVSVPRYQPANVNRGIVQFAYQGQTYNFGDHYVDADSGKILGDSGVPELSGPLAIGTGLPIGTGAAGANPAGGYLSQVLVYANVPDGDNISSALSANDVRLKRANRTFVAGTAVQPQFKLRIAETTVDLGEMPAGAGYSAKTNSTTPPYYATPFAPSFSSNYSNGNSPWDDIDFSLGANSMGSFFKEFTIINESNVNLVDVRLAKLLGVPGASISFASLANSPDWQTAASSRLNSDAVSSLSGLALYGLPFASTGVGNGVGNIGLVSSLDHASYDASRNLPQYAENSMFTFNGAQNIQNPYVKADGITASGVNLRPTMPNALSLLNWNAGLQPRPTIHKSRPGDTQGQEMIIPDRPYDAVPDATVVTRKPKVGIAIPVGTPAGTYATPVYAYEDNIPIQWREWLTRGLGVGEDGIGRSQDGTLNLAVNRNTGQTGAPVEPFTDPAMVLKVNVTETRLTSVVTRPNQTIFDIFKGTVGQVDSPAQTAANANVLPTAMRVPDNNGNIALYWATDRGNAGNANAAYSLAYSILPGASSFGPGTDYNMARPDLGNPFNSLWWTAPTFYPTGTNPPATADVAALFPSQANTNGLPFLPGTPNASTVRHASPVLAQAVNLANVNDTEAWLFWQGQVDKGRTVVAANAPIQLTDTRTFYSAVNADGTPSGTVVSFLNDPSLPKLGPKPVIVKNGGGRFAYLFWYSGGSGQTSLYYNVNPTDGLPAANWSADTKLPLPGGISWQSDPAPIYRRTVVNGTLSDVVDVAFTGILRGRRKVETLLCRYLIGSDGKLSLVALSDGTRDANNLLIPAVVSEQATREKTGPTWTTRDAGWLLRDGDQTDAIRIDLRRANGTLIALNKRQGPNATDAADIFKLPMRGKFDQASGLVYYDSNLGGQIAVDIRSGTVSFPNVAPNVNDKVLVSYTPQIMRLDTGREIGATLVNSNWLSSYKDSEVSTSGNNTNPIVIFDRGANTRAKIYSPQVVQSGTPVHRLWVMYRKGDTGSKDGIYYKALRLMVKLPTPVALTAPNNGIQSIANLTVTGNSGAYEIDWQRGRVLFTEVDENRLLTVNYTDASGVKQVTGRVAWGDEITTVASEIIKSNPNVSVSSLMDASSATTPEVAMPTTGGVNEGQVTAFKDPFWDRLWVFWTSTRSGTSDLFYQALSPQLYGTSANEKYR